MSAKQKQRIADLKERQDAVRAITQSKRVTPTMRKQYEDAARKVSTTVMKGETKSGKARWMRSDDAIEKSRKTQGKVTKSRAKLDRAYETEYQRRLKAGR